jgi:hypothetical protein
MKYKLLILVIIASLLTYIIYYRNYHYIISITSINSLTTNNNYNEYLATKLTNNPSKFKLNVDFSNENYEIENVIALLQNNEHNIQSIIHDSSVLIISLGNNDLKTENLKTIQNELTTLFQLLRKYNSKQIIFVNPLQLTNITAIKSLCHYYQITYINTLSYVKPYIINDELNKPANQILAKVLYQKIVNAWHLT